MAKPVWHQRLVLAFDEWAKRYAENPSEFENILDENGNVIEGYGEKCATYLTELLNELPPIESGFYDA